MLIDYAQVSTDQQSLDLQPDALKATSCRRVFTDKAFTTKAIPPGLAKAGSRRRDRGVLVIWKLDRQVRTAKLLNAATFRVLRTPPPGSDYVCGWIVAKGIWAGGRTLYHEGSNQAWYANLGLAPARNLALLVATNRGDSVALTAVRHAFGTLIRSLDLPDDVFARP
jgi:hypothetical protein